MSAPWETRPRPSAEPRSFLPYEVPLRPGVMARLVLPVDLTEEEADRLCRVIKSLGFEKQEVRPGAGYNAQLAGQ